MASHQTAPCSALRLQGMQHLPWSLRMVGIRLAAKAVIAHWEGLDSFIAAVILSATILFRTHFSMGAFPLP